MGGVEKEVLLKEGYIVSRAVLRPSCTFQQLPLSLLSMRPPCPGRDGSVWSLILVTPRVNPLLRSLVSHPRPAHAGLPLSLSPGPPPPGLPSAH